MENQQEKPMLLLAPPKKRVPTFLSIPVRVPKGFPLPLGKTVDRPFDLTVMAGARWCPEWEEPRVVVAAYRFLSLGDAIGFTGDRAAIFDLPDTIKALIPFHGQEHISDEAKKALAALGLDIPESRETYEALIVHKAAPATKH